MQPLLERLAALTNGHDDVRLETAGRVAGRWLAMDSDAGHELIAAGLLILAGPFDGDHLAGGFRLGLDERSNQAPQLRCQSWTPTPHRRLTAAVFHRNAAITLPG